MENIKLINNIESEVTQLQGAKKLKVRALDYEHIMEMVKKSIVKNAFREEKKEPVLESRKPEEERLEKPKLRIVPEAREKEESEKEYNFAYSGHKPEEDVTSDDIDKINEKLGKTYKEAPKEEKKPKVEIKEEKPKEEVITKEAFEEALATKDNFSPKIINFKEAVKKDYDGNNKNIELKQQEIDNITKKYGEETEIGTKLQESKKDAQDTMNGINGLDLDFLTGKEDDFVRNALNALEALFNDRREKYNRIKQELRSNTSRKEELGKLEQKAREELKELKKVMAEFMKDNYSQLVKANKIDDAYKETSEEITELTGIENDTIFPEPEREFVNVSSSPQPSRQFVSGIENLKEKQVVNGNNFGNNVPNMGNVNSQNTIIGAPTVPNRFDPLRQEDMNGGYKRAAV